MYGHPRYADNGAHLGQVVQVECEAGDPTMNDDVLEPQTDSYLKQTWRDNHGSMILGVAMVIAVAGAGWLGWERRTSGNQSSPAAMPRRSNGITVAAAGVEATSANSIMFEIVGAQGDLGMMRLTIYDSENQFNKPSKPVVELEHPIEGGEARMMIRAKRLPDSFAVVVFHSTLR